MSKFLKVKFVCSVIGADKSQRETVRCLGLRRLNQIKQLPDNAVTRGMITKVGHLVKVVEG